MIPRATIPASSDSTSDQNKSYMEEEFRERNTSDLGNAPSPYFRSLTVQLLGIFYPKLERVLSKIWQTEKKPFCGHRRAGDWGPMLRPNAKQTVKSLCLVPSRWEVGSFRPPRKLAGQIACKGKQAVLQSGGRKYNRPESLPPRPINFKSARRTGSIRCLISFWDLDVAPIYRYKDDMGRNGSPMKAFADPEQITKYVSTMWILMTINTKTWVSRHERSRARRMDSLSGESQDRKKKKSQTDGKNPEKSPEVKHTFQYEAVAFRHAYRMDNWAGEHQDNSRKRFKTTTK
ncbi:hypothetical protein K438DRAFT_1755487 [Mycena galopus ATCC 62051]|nr:hypothetical protein K438DRAFT_1755487 [Mycena galopus ATCC 62051]